jgi:Sodium Bile acid symporter family
VCVRNKLFLISNILLQQTYIVVAVYVYRWCSLFNADLALSVTMTALSTLLSMFMLPANLLLYARLCYEGDILELLNWWALFTALAIVIGAITLGLCASSYYDSKYFHLMCNNVGNVCGIALVTFSAVLSNSNEESQLWDRDWKFYFGVAAPCAFSLIISNVLTWALKLKPPERITVSIEGCYQNVGIATSMALTMFEGEELAEALGVPFFYGLVEAVLVGIYCLVAWKVLGWSKAPKDVSLWKALTTSYEVLALDEDEDMVIVSKKDVEMTEKDSEKEDDEDFHYVDMAETEKDNDEKVKEDDEKVDDEEYAYVEHTEAEFDANATAEV